MIYAGILAGGIGSRMGIQDMPKQFLMLGNKPIIIHTIEKFLVVPDIDQVYVAVHPNWLVYFNDLVSKHLPGHESKIKAVDGGGDRNDSILNIISDIKATGPVSDQAILITHDAVRPFVSYRMIQDNIKVMADYDATDTVVMANDTIVESQDGKSISSIPNRAHMFQGQTPQTFRINQFDSLFASLRQDEREILTDACKVFVLKGKSVGLVKGEYSNLKITTVTDLKIAEAMLGEI